MEYAMRGPSGRIWGREITDATTGEPVGDARHMQILREMVVEGGLTLVSRESADAAWRAADWPEPYEAFTAATADLARELVPNGLECLSRMPEDDPAVLEVWL